MPELPEVETIARALRGQQNRVAEKPASPALIGRQIREARVFWARTLATPAPVEFGERVRGQKILAIERRGKYLLFRLSQDTLLVHLRMTGDMIVEPSGSPSRKHDRLVLELDAGLRLVFNDTRKFGRVWLVSDPESVLGSLGPEPLADEFTPRRLSELIEDRRRQLKPLLLDQGVIAGLGNIYVDEALHLAGLHPLRQANELTGDEVETLWRAIRDVLEQGIRRHGASIDWAYRGGEFQNYFQVYQRSGENCYRCGAEIQRIVVGQRGTHYCPGCQPEP